MLSLRGSQCAAHPCSKVVGTQSLGRQACEAKRDSQSQGCRGSKACRHSASDVDRRYRIQLVIKGGCQSTCIAGQPKSRRSAGTNVPAGTLALVRSPLALRCSREQNALHTLIHQRHLTPSCRGQAPTAERTLNPARMFTESLILGPELENTLIHQRNSFRTIRGRTLLTAVFDESAFWRSDESASPDTEVYRAILPSLSKNALEAQLRLPHLLLRWLAVASKLTRFTHTSRFTHTLCFPKIPSG